MQVARDAEKNKQSPMAPPVASPLVPLLRHREITSWPKHDAAPDIEHRPLVEVLTRKFATDAHIGAYSCEAKPKRLSSNALESGLVVNMVALVFNVDDHMARDDGKPASSTWYRSERAKLGWLLEFHRGGFVYWTRGGFRIVYLLQDWMIRSSEDAERWRQFYLRECCLLYRHFRIIADPTCRDWTRLYRLPRATRDDGFQPEMRHTIGDAKEIGVWNHRPLDTELYSDLAVIETLAHEYPSWAACLRKAIKRAKLAEAPWAGLEV